MIECHSVSVDIAPIAISGSDMEGAGCMIGNRVEEDVKRRFITIQVDHFR